MTITILQGAFLPVPPLMGGAVEKIWFEMGKQFAARGHQVTHVSRRHPDLPGDEEIEGVRHLRVPGFDTPASLVKLKLLDFIYTLRARRVLPEADIVVTNTFWAPLLLKPRLGNMVVSVQRMPRRQMRWYRHAPRWHAVSSAVRDAILAEVPRENERIRVIPNPLPFTRDLKSTFAPNDKHPLILYAGRIHPEKGLDILMTAFRQIQNDPATAGWQLELAGPWSVAEGGGGEDYMNALRKLIHGLPVTFHGPIHQADALEALYRQASIFVYPSVAERGETFGVAPLEAMALGAVPIVSDLACFKDFIRHGRNGLIFDHRQPNASEGLATAILELVKDTAMRERLAAAAVAVNETHAPGRIAEMFLADFEELRAKG